MKSKIKYRYLKLCFENELSTKKSKVKRDEDLWTKQFNWQMMLFHTTGKIYFSFLMEKPILVSNLYSINSLDSLLNINFFWFLIGTQFYQKANIDDLLQISGARKNK